MYASLMTWAIGIKGLDLAQTIDLAAETGFEGVWFDIVEAKAIADEKGLDHLKDMFALKGVKPGGWGAPVSWQDDSKRDADLAALPALAELGVALGNPFTTTGIMPANNDRPFDEQYAWILERLTPYAKVLDASGVRLGIEFITPKTIRDRFTYEFIYTMKEMLKLGADTGVGNVGVLFDVWHHYAAYGVPEDLDDVSKEQIQVVHVNDAPVGVPIDELIDNQRELPAATGVIPAPAMMQQLARIGYDGPVIAEPFNQPINDLAATGSVAAAKKTRESIAKLYAQSGL